MTRRQTLGALAAAGAVTGARPGAATVPPGWFMPAEEAAQSATIMQWPVSRAVYDDRRFLEDVQDAIARIANTIAEFQPVIMLADRAHHRDLADWLSSDVTLWDIPTDDLWARDSAPVFLLDGAGGLAATGFNFNGWGNRQPHRNDARIAEAVAARFDIPFFDSGLVGEGGGVESDGHGTLMAHESSWVHDNRNPGLSRATIEARLLSALGGERMFWAPGLRDLDITDYHIDALARFTGPGQVIIQLPDEIFPGDPWSAAAYETHDILADAGLEITVIPEPTAPRVRDEDFVASYVNYVLVNGAVIAAAFGDRRTDAIARDTLAELYPDREIVMLNVDPLGEIGGGIHCATQQVPVP